MANWSREEVEAIVANHFYMLELELKRNPFNKTEHRRHLKRLLHKRTDGSIERKHQNISAILIELGFPYVSGYKPLRNYQQLLYDVVASTLETAQRLVSVVRNAVDEPAETASPIILPLDFESPPVPERGAGGHVSDSAYGAYRRPRFVDYLARESRNVSLGAAGEKLVVDFEIERLRRAGRVRLSERVEHVSMMRGDGLGFDIMSFESDGRERLIEVKTTAFGKSTPFYLTRNELQCSHERAPDYHLYRVFTFRQAPRIFALDGPLDQVCRLDPVQYLARVS